MENLTAFLRANWKPLAIVLGVIFGTFVLVQFTDYGATLWHRLRADKEQTEAEAQHGQRQATSARRHTDYLVDSADRAATRRYLLLADSTLAAQDHALSTSRPARVDLPTSPQPGN